MNSLRLCAIGIAFGLLPSFLFAEEDLPELSSFLTWEINKARGESPEAPIPAEYLLTIESFTVSRPHPNGDIPTYADLQGIEHLANLRELELIERYIPDLSVIASLQKLENLTLRFCGVSDISPLASLQNLRRLDLSANAISDYSALASLKDLESLVMGGWYYFTGGLPVSSHPPSDDSQDETPSPPNIASRNLPSDWSFLSSLENLTSLSFPDSDLKDLDFLAAVPQLTELIVILQPDGPFQIPAPTPLDLSALANVPMLERLDLRTVAIGDASALGHLANLRELILRNCALDDVSALSQLLNLNYVDLRGNPLLTYANVSEALKHVEGLVLDGFLEPPYTLSERPSLADLDGDGEVTFSLHAVGEGYVHNLFWTWRWGGLVNPDDWQSGDTLQLTVPAGNPVVVTLYSSIVGGGQPFDYHQIPVDDAYIPDPVLRSAVGGISPASVESVDPQMQFLDASGLGVSTLEGLPYFKKLRQLDLSSNAIEDISPLLDFPALELVDISQNPLNLTPGSPASQIVEQLRANGVVVLDREWFGFPADAAGNVSTGAIAGWVHAYESSTWVWSWTLGKLICIPPEGVSPDGVWLYLTHHESTGETDPIDTWAGFPFVEEIHVDTYSLLSWIVAPPDTPWIYSWMLNNWLYLPETAVQPAGAWAYALR